MSVPAIINNGVSKIENRRGAWVTQFKMVEHLLSDFEKTLLVTGIEKVKEAHEEQDRVKVGLLDPVIAGKIIADRLASWALVAGIRNPSQNELQVTLSHMLAYCKDLSVSEMALSFHLYAAGKTDEFLPLDKGQPNRNHYNLLSPEFVQRIFRAYKGLKSKTWAKYQAKA